MTLIYIHGFNSSSASVKAQRLREYLQDRGYADQFLAPDLPHRPSRAITKLESKIAATIPKQLL